MITNHDQRLAFQAEMRSEAKKQMKPNEYPGTKTWVEDGVWGNKSTDQAETLKTCQIKPKMSLNIEHAGVVPDPWLWDWCEPTDRKASCLHRRQPTFYDRPNGHKRLGLSTGTSLRRQQQPSVPYTIYARPSGRRRGGDSVMYTLTVIPPASRTLPSLPSNQIEVMSDERTRLPLSCHVAARLRGANWSVAHNR